MRAIGFLARAIAGAATLVVAGWASAATMYFHNDLAGSPVVATNASGQVLWRESYRPYGERLKLEPASVNSNIWFTGRHEDSHTELVYMGARYYDPKMGRFLSIDPVLFAESNLHSFNRYVYANNNPYAYSDPDGRNPAFILQLISRASAAIQGGYARAQLALGSALNSGAGQIATGIAASEAGTPSFAGKVPQIFEEALQRGVRVTDPETGALRQIVHDLGDGLQVRLRQDFGDFSHGKTDHWNIQVMAKGKGGEISNIHVYVDSAGNPIRAIDSRGVWNAGKEYEFSARDLPIPR